VADLERTAGSVTSIWSGGERKKSPVERHRDRREAEAGVQRGTISCGHCPADDRFSHVGSIKDGRAAFLSHLAERHPEIDPVSASARRRRRPDTRK